MSASEENIPFNKLLNDVEEHLNWGASATWKDSHFQSLSKAIHEKTGLSLSISTLKRVFGKIRTENDYSPQQATLNGLSIFLGYNDWLDYLAKNNYSDTYGAEYKKKNKSGRLPYILSGALAACIIVIFLLLINKSSTPESISTQTCEPPYIEVYPDKIWGDSIPLEVNYTVKVGNYPIKGDKGNFFLETGNVHILYHNNKYNFKSEYKDYGLYKGKLFLNDKLTSNTTVCVKSPGWLITALSMRGQRPVSDRIALDDQKAKSEFFDTYNSSATEYYHYKYENYNLFPINADFMDFKLDFSSKEGNTANQPFHSLILILEGEYERIYVQLADKKNNNSASYLQVSETYREKGAAELKNLSINFSPKSTLQLISSGKKLDILVNNEELTSINYKNDIGNIRGIVIRSNSYLNIHRLQEGGGKQINWEAVF